MLRKLLTANMAFALLLICGGALAAGQLFGNAERVTVMVVTAMMALFVVVGGNGDGDAPAALTGAGAKTSMPAKLTDDPQFQPLLDALSDAVLIVENARVTHANAAALQLLGSNIIGHHVAHRDRTDAQSRRHGGTRCGHFG